MATIVLLLPVAPLTLAIVVIAGNAGRISGWAKSPAAAGSVWRES
jgi:hypothetical protein